MAWFCNTVNPPPVATPSPPIIKQQKATAAPASTFPGENPLLQFGNLTPQDPTSPTAFIPLPPVKY